MRERKQRAWLHNQKMMVQVAAINYIYKYIEWYDTSECKDGAEEFDLLRGGPNAECTFESCDIVDYTGLQDRNGKEIYEGDILKDDEGIAQVVFEDGQFMAHYQALSGKWNPYGTLSKYMGDHDGEIIGNIYETPLDKAI